jgi:hypothetical protein
MEYLGAWGTLIHEKNLKLKISCQTLFKSAINPSLGKKSAKVHVHCTAFRIVL